MPDIHIVRYFPGVGQVTFVLDGATPLADVGKIVAQQSALALQVARASKVHGIVEAKSKASNTKATLTVNIETQLIELVMPYLAKPGGGFDKDKTMSIKNSLLADVPNNYNRDTYINEVPLTLKNAALILANMQRVDFQFDAYQLVNWYFASLPVEDNQPAPPAPSPTPPAPTPPAPPLDDQQSYKPSTMDIATGWEEFYALPAEVEAWAKQSANSDQLFQNLENYINQGERPERVVAWAEKALMHTTIPKDAIRGWCVSMPNDADTRFKQRLYLAACQEQYLADQSTVEGAADDWQ